MAFEVFSDFPYFKVGNYIFDNYYGGLALVDDYKANWPTNKLTQIWYYYEQGLKDGAIKPVDIKTDLSSLYYLESVTPYKRADLIWWLTAVQALAKAALIDAEYYTGKGIATNPVEKLTRGISNAIQGAAKGAKVGMGFAGGALVIYLAWPVIMGTARKRISRRFAK